MSSSIRRIIVLVVLLAAAVSACKKDAQPEKHYFGQLSVSLFALPGTPEKINVKINGKNVATDLNAVGSSFPFDVPGDEPFKLGLYMSGTDSLLMDTTLTVKANSSTGFKVALSPVLGISGALNLPTRPVPPDSSFVVLLNNLDPAIFSDAIDMEMFLLDGNTWIEAPTGIVYKNIVRNKLYPGFMYNIYEEGPDGQPSNNFWVQKFKNLSTGQYVFQPTNGAEWGELGPDPGHNVLVVLSSDPQGSVLFTYINLD